MVGPRFESGCDWVQKPYVYDINNIIILLITATIHWQLTLRDVEAWTWYWNTTIIMFETTPIACISMPTVQTKSLVFRAWDLSKIIWLMNARASIKLRTPKTMLLTMTLVDIVFFLFLMTAEHHKLCRIHLKLYVTPNPST